MQMKYLPTIKSPADLKKLPVGELPRLAEEIRQAICDQVSRTGGHLAPNLGVVELTIAMHYVYDFSYDRLLFDVGHQCYPHKLLTGRLPLLDKLKQKGGMAGFPEPHESEFDLFRVGHAGTAISTAVGMARGDTLNGEADRRVVSIIGDASIVNGLSLEGLNNAGTLDRQFLVVLNDNGMSIDKPQGALAKHFDRLRVSPQYGGLKRRAKKLIDGLPGAETIEEIYHRAGDMLKAAIDAGHMFDEFGLLGLGPIDGHDIEILIDILTEIKDLQRPVLLHCKTIKGKGFDFTADDPTTFHSTNPFVVEGSKVELKKSGRSFTSAYADAMMNLMAGDEKIFAVTAAMPDGTGLDKVMGKYPERTLDTGICESHAMDMCAGLAKTGIKPFFAVYSTFAQRALDQVFQEIALHSLPVRICLDRAGFVGGDGAIHHGFMDIAMFHPLPGVVMLAPSDEQNLVAGLEFMRQYEDGPTIIRYPRDSVATEPLQEQVPPFVLGKANLVRPAQVDKPHLAVLAYGIEVYHAAQAIEDLEPQGYNISLYDARFAKPVDIELIRHLVEQDIMILTVEDHAVTGGFGSCVVEACNDHKIPTDKIHRLGMAHQWYYHDSRKGQIADAQLDANGIARTIRRVLNGSVAGEVEHLPPHIEVRVGNSDVKATR